MNMASMSKDHSISFLNCQAEDTLMLTVEETWWLEDLATRTLKFGTSIKSQRQSRIRSTTNHSTFRMLVNHKTCKSGRPTVTGSNNSDSSEWTSWALRATRYLMYKLTEMLKDKTFSLGPDMMDWIRDGRFCILTRRRKNQPRELIKTLDSIEIDHSTSLPRWAERESLHWRATTLSCNPRVKTTKDSFGTLTTWPELSSHSNSRASQLTLATQDVDKTCRSGRQAENGGNSSNTRTECLWTNMERS